MERDFRYLRDKYGDAGAREVFEKICTELLISLYGEKAHPIKASQGDDGIDILVGDFTMPMDVYQCKYLIEGINASQREQITNSFKTAINSQNFTMKKWILCLPCDLTIKEFQWWSDWRIKHTRLHNIEIELYDGSYLLLQLKKTDLYKSLFDNDVILILDDIQKSLNAQKQKQLDEIIVLLKSNDPNLYDDTVFVRKLENAHISEIDGCKRDFFNAELAEQSVRSQGNDENILLIQKLKNAIYSIWETQFRKYKDESNGNDLLTRVYERVEELDTTSLATSLSYYSLLSKKGILHQLADECSVGWLSDYQKKLDQYLKELNDNDEKHD
jgi:hypothetical protein